MIHTALQKISCILYITLFLTACSDSPQSLDELMTTYAENGRQKISSPFSGAVLVSRNGEIIFKKAYGLNNRELNNPNTIDTKFPIGSITKQFTAMLIMQMVEEGKLSLNDSVSKHIPYFPKEFGDKLTIHQLLSNTSGLPHYEGIVRNGVRFNTFASTRYSPKELALLIGK